MSREQGKMFGVVPYLENLREEFERNLDIQFRDELDERDNRMTNLQLDCNGVLIRVKRRHTASERFKIDLRALTPKQEDREYLSYIADKVGCVVREDGKYAKLNIFDQFVAVEEAVPVLEKLYESINSVDAA
ncbi:hypothetical protein NX722_16205 [Endozoicomonas gorgoniicola]|uniref:Uncharacterized protein n=1 Tax=Endozoicomonas gorgoniicola TaxID=1234144 RepID=A0ABT3MXL7_9GAMM|nr:hypothetical protein [Endozoicomonas gorgoniicola]MCW7554134.1 hypothetical protein [Endozoicomonas gorgoniicola]